MAASSKALSTTVTLVDAVIDQASVQEDTESGTLQKFTFFYATADTGVSYGLWRRASDFNTLKNNTKLDGSFTLGENKKMCSGERLYHEYLKDPFTAHN